MFNGLHLEPVYNTRAVVIRTGVPADTFRAWERRYRLPAPCRSNGNQRLYSDRDVAIIKWLRDQTRAGLTISHAVTLFFSLESSNVDHSYPEASNLSEALDAANATQFPIRPANRLSFFDQCMTLIDALSRYDVTSAERLITDLAEVESVETICHEVLRPSMNELRRRRETKIVPVGVERFAQAFMHRKVSALFNLSQPEVGRGPIVAAGVEGDYDEIELLFLSLFLSRNGFSVIYLGSDIAACELLAAISALHPKLVVLNASSESVAHSLQDALDTLEHDEAPGERPLIGVTGSLFERAPDLQQSINATFIGNDGFHAVRACDQLIAAQADVR